MTKPRPGSPNSTISIPVAGQALLWTRSQLTSHSYLDATYGICRPGPPRTGRRWRWSHGSPRDEDEYVFSPAQAYENLLEPQHDVTFCGHTHYQGGFSLHEGEIDVLYLRPGENAPYRTMHLEAGRRYLLNPGSVGQPRDGDPRAAFALVDIIHKKVEFWRAPYDIAAVQRRMTESNAPEMLVSRLEWRTLTMPATGMLEGKSKAACWGCCSSGPPRCGASWRRRLSGRALAVVLEQTPPNRCRWARRTRLMPSRYTSPRLKFPARRIS